MCEQELITRDDAIKWRDYLLEHAKAGEIATALAITTVELYTQIDDLRTCLAEEVEKCCRDVCPYCKEEHCIDRLPNGEWMHFSFDEFGDEIDSNECGATLIHERVYREG